MMARTRRIHVSINQKKHSVDINDGTNKENLHFDDQSKEVVFFFTAEFSKRNRKHVLHISV